MKEIKFFAMALAALAIISCSKEKTNNGNNEQPPVVEGVETYASFSFNVEGSGTKSKAASETDADKTAEEETVKDIRIVIFKSGTPSTLEANNVTEMIDGVLTATPFKITSGQKRIFVFANTKENNYLNSLKDGSNLNECYASLMTPDPFTLTSFVSATNGYFMSNARTQGSSKLLRPNVSADAAKTAGSENNHFTFTVQRAVAKVSAQIIDKNILTIMDPVDPLIPIATFSDLKYTVRNINKSIRPVQLFAETDISDDDAALKTTLPLAPYFNSFDGKLDSFMKDLSNFGDYDRSFEFDQIISENTTTAVFVTENTNARQVLGNTTYLAVQAKYKPTTVVGKCVYKSSVNSGTFEPEAGTLGPDFFVVNLAGLHTIGLPGKGLKNNIFDTHDNAKALLTAVLDANGITPGAGQTYDNEIATRIRTYTDGLTYYRLNIGVTENGKTTFGIKRNSHYKVVISKINKLGANSPDDLNKNPETPVTSLETYVSATINVAQWVSMNQTGEL